ncbi:signal peptidase [Bacillus pakistanensis]|uniref:Signal peptidase I n=1 Tax=Rossellomorea pakistanensis TaxID=992288 RepID=A0ABS2NHC0_9BACI|nr:signal peptidase I [Bacillus pakistanensis]MBM7587213.1 signal peptidase [Bacillus pakistanensis]
MEQIISFLKKVVLIAIILFIMIIIFSIFVSLNSNKPLTVFGIKPLTVLSNSMAPIFEAGDVIITREVETGDLRKGDIISFYNEEKKLITHRITAIVEEDGEKHFYTKGDNNNAMDEEITTVSEIVGKEIFHIPNLGFLAHYTKGPMGFLLFIALPLTGYVCLTVYEKMKPKQKQEKFTKS